MKRALVLLALLGCADLPAGDAPADSPPPSDLEFEKFVVTQFAFDPALVRAGARATYAVRMQGSPLTEYHVLSAVTQDPVGLWVEIRQPHGTTGMIVKSLYDRTGRLLERWIGPPGGSPAQIYPPSGQAPAAPPRTPVTSASREESERVVLGGRTYACLKVTSPIRYPDGRTGGVTSWFSTEVPFSGTAKYGGLVRRVAGRATLELLGHADRGAKPELVIPK